MATNTFASDLLPKIYAGSQNVLYESVPILPLVTRENNWGTNSIEGVGKQLVFNIPQPFGEPDDFSPSMTPATPDSMNLGSVGFDVDQMKSVSFQISYDDAVNYHMNNVIPGQLANAVRSLGNGMNKFLMDKKNYISGIAGTAGTGIFASSLDALSTVKRQLVDQLCPLDNLHFNMTTQDYEDYFKLDAVQKSMEYGSDEAVKMGILGSRFGFGLMFSNYATKYTAGAGINTSLTVAEDAAVGATTVSVTDGGGASVFTAGTSFYFSGDTVQDYCLPTATTITAGATADITLNRPLTVAVSAGETITIDAASGTAYQGIAGDMKGFGLGFRNPLAGIRAAGGDVIGQHQYGVDPRTGANLLVSMIPGDMMFSFRVMSYYGGGVVQDQYLTKVATVATL